MKSKTLRRQEAAERAEGYTGKPEEKPCSSCDYHENNPSYCRKLVKYVGRKDTCLSHKA